MTSLLIGLSISMLYTPTLFEYFIIQNDKKIDIEKSESFVDIPLLRKIKPDI